MFQTGAMPHFEARAEFIAAYDTFLAGVPSASARIRVCRVRSHLEPRWWGLAQP